MHIASTRLLLSAALLAVLACGDNDDSPDASCKGAACDDHDAATGEGPDAGERSDAGVEDDASAGSTALDSGDGMQSVIIRFKAKLGSQDLVCGQQYTKQGTTQLTATPQDFRFFVQEVRLVHKGSSREEKVAFDVAPPFQRSEVALIDFTNADGNCGGSGGSIVNTTITGKVPAGEYDGIVFVNGVPEELNHAGPAETAKAPLDDVTLFWGWLSGYRFIVAELLPVAGAHDAGQSSDGGSTHDDAGADTGTLAHDAAATTNDAGPSHGGDAGGHAASEAAFVHVGSTGCSGNQSTAISCTRQARNEIRFASFDPSRSILVADLAEVFKTSDLRAPPQCHGIAAPCAAPYAALGVNMDTGNPGTSQQVFRVE